MSIHLNLSGTRVLFEIEEPEKNDDWYKVSVFASNGRDLRFELQKAEVMDLSDTSAFLAFLRRFLEGSTTCESFDFSEPDFVFISNEKPETISWSIRFGDHWMNHLRLVFDNMDEVRKLYDYLREVTGILDPDPKLM